MNAVMPLRALAGVGARGEGDVLRHAAVRDVDLRAVDAPAAVDLLGPGLRARGVRAGVGLGEPERADRLALRHRHQEPQLLLLGAVAVDRAAAERDVRRQRDAGRAAGARDLLDRDRVGQRVEAGAAVLLGERQPEEAQLGHLLHDVGGELLALVEVARTRRDHLVGEFARHLAHLVVFVVQQQHRRSAPFRSRGGARRARGLRGLPACGHRFHENLSHRRGNLKSSDSRTGRSRRARRRARGAPRRGPIQPVACLAGSSGALSISRRPAARARAISSGARVTLPSSLSSCFQSNVSSQRAPIHLR